MGHQPWGGAVVPRTCGKLDYKQPSPHPEATSWSPRRVQQPQHLPWSPFFLLSWKDRLSQGSLSFLCFLPPSAWDSEPHSPLPSPSCGHPGVTVPPPTGSALQPSVCFLLWAPLLQRTRAPAVGQSRPGSSSGAARSWLG